MTEPLGPASLLMVLGKISPGKIIGFCNLSPPSQANLNGGGRGRKPGVNDPGVSQLGAGQCFSLPQTRRCASSHWSRRVDVSCTTSARGKCQQTRKTGGRSRIQRCFMAQPICVVNSGSQEGAPAAAGSSGHSAGPRETRGTRTGTSEQFKTLKKAACLSSTLKPRVGSEFLFTAGLKLF